MQAEPPEPIHCCGPFDRNNRTLFRCPVCDDDQVTGIDGAPTLCCVDWLRGQWIVGDGRVGNRTCHCFVTDPFENEPGATNAQRRYYFYRTLAILLGGSGQRVDLPACVKEAIQQLYGDSQTGYHQ